MQWPICYSFKCFIIHLSKRLQTVYKENASNMGWRPEPVKPALQFSFSNEYSNCHCLAQLVVNHTNAIYQPVQCIILQWYLLWLHKMNGLSKHRHPLQKRPGRNLPLLSMTVPWGSYANHGTPYAICTRLLWLLKSTQSTNPCFMHILCNCCDHCNHCLIYMFWFHNSFNYHSENQTYPVQVPVETAWLPKANGSLFQERSCEL
jgi:hypothetical protein